MSENPSPLNDPTPPSGNSSGGDFIKLFGTGVAGWLLGMGALFAVSWMIEKPETASIAMLWVLSHCWIAFLVGLVLMTIRGLASRGGLAKSLLAYALPVALLAILCTVCLIVYPDNGFQGDLLTYLPVVLVFYVLGYLWLALGAKRADGGAFLQAVIPSLAGGLMILGFVAVPAFASDEFHYRNAFKLSCKERKVQDQTLVFEGTLEIFKPGNYGFSAPRYVWDENVSNGMADLELGEIQWGEPGPPKAGAQGTFPLRIVWKKGIFRGNNAQFPLDEEDVTIEVHKPDEGNKVVYSITASSPGK